MEEQLEDMGKQLKTSYQWYLEDHEFDIYDPDGWRIGPGKIDQSYHFWFSVPVTEVEYLYRRNKSTVGGYMSRRHRSPLGSWEKYRNRTETRDSSKSESESLPKLERKNSGSSGEITPPESCREGFCVMPISNSNQNENEENDPCILL